MTLIERAQKQVQSTRPRILLSELADDRVAAAAKDLERMGCHIVEPDMSLSASHFVQPFLDRKPSLSRERAEEYAADPTYRAAAMLALGQADMLVAGAITETATVLRAGLRAIGLSQDAPLICSSFLMFFPDGRQFLCGDCAANLDPNAEQLTHIGVHLGKAAKALFGEARLALLSYSTGTSGTGSSVDVVDKATRALQSMGLTAFGPVQGDAALNPDTGARKGMGDVHPNTLIFPNLNAGNISYKLMQELAGAQAIGPLLHGFARPMADLSRGATQDDIVKVVLVAHLEHVALTEVK